MPLTPGTLLGPYQLVSFIGAGGMGEVYSAIDTRLDRRVAVKRLVGPHTDRFRREAHAIAALNHPNVCTLYDIGADYLVMEYLEGRPLNGPVPPKAAVQYAVQICDALEAAHTAIVGSLREKLTTAAHYEPSRRPTQNMAAYDAYLKGTFHLHRLMASDLRRGAALLEEATRADPEFTLALVGLSVYYSTTAIQGYAPSSEVLPRAEDLARRALQVDPQLPEAHRAFGLARLFQWDWSGAEAAQHRAITLRPAYAQGYGDLAFGKSLRGERDLAVRFGEQAVALEPLDPMFGWFLTQSLCLAGDLERAVAQGRATIALDQTYLPTYWWVAMAQWQLGERQEAVETLAPALVGDDPLGLSMHASLVGQLGRTEEAHSIALELEKKRQGGWIAGAALVGAWSGAGKTDRALDWLESSFQARDASLILLRGPWFDPLRPDPRFEAVTRAIGGQTPARAADASVSPTT